MDQYLSLLRFFHALVAYKVTDFRIKWICFSMENWQHLPREVGNVHTMIGWNGHPFGNIRFHQSIFIQRWNDGKSEEKHNDQNRVIPGLFRTHLELHERGSSTSESGAKLAFLHASSTTAKHIRKTTDSLVGSTRRNPSSSYNSENPKKNSP